MHRIYSKVWNKSLGQLVVASELASSGSSGATGAGRSMPKVGVLAVGLAALLQGWPLVSPASTISTDGGAACAAAGTTQTGPDGVVRTAVAQTDGSDNLSLVSGCSAQGGGYLGVTAFGAYTVIAGDGGTAFGYAASAGEHGTSLGLAANAAGMSSVAIGDSASAQTAQAVALGAFATAQGGEAVSIGGGNTASGNGAVAIGGGDANVATGNGVLAIGTGNTAIRASTDTTDPSGVVALGNGNTAGSFHGGSRTYGPATGVVAIGQDNTATGPGSVALGYGSRARITTNFPSAAPYYGTVAIGYEADATSGGIAMGHTAGAGRQSIALGFHSTSDNNSVSLGANTNSTQDSVALGTDAQGLHDSVAIGTGAQADAVSIQIDPTHYEFTSGSVAIGRNAIANKTELGDGGGMVAIGEGATVGRTAGIAMGQNASVTAAQGLAVGMNAAVSGVNATAIGVDSVAAGEDAIAMGNGAQANGAQSISIGTGNIVNGIGSGAFGDPNTVNGAGSYAFGNDNTIDADNAFVLGNNVTVAAGLDGAVVLGNDSTVEASTIASYDPGTSGVVGTAIGSNVVSVGSAGGERRITNVAAGGADTDAVNVSQLKAVEAVAGAGWNVSDGTSTANIGPGGTVTFTGDGNISVNQIGVDDDGEIELALSDNLDLGATGTLTIGGTVVSGGGVAIGTDVILGGTGLVINGGPSVTTGGIDAGSLQITNVVAGTAPTDAVNVSQLEDAIDGVAGSEYYSVNSTGGGNEANDGATGADAIAAGKDAEADGDESVAMGLGATSSGNGAMAFGADAQALSLNSVAIGAGAVASHGNSIALGAGSATTVGAQAGYQGAFVGNSSSTGEMNIGGRQVTGVAAGSAGNDAVNVDQLQGGVDSAVATSNEYTDTQIGNVNTTIGDLDNRLTTVEGDITDIQGDVTDIQGDITDIQGDITDIDGRVTNVEGDIGDLSTTVNTFDDRVDGLENGSSGMFQVSQDINTPPPTPTGLNSAAGGAGASASGDNALAVGNDSTASGDGSTALGNGASATSDGSTAIGSGSQATHGNSVALGGGSATTVGAQTDYNAAYVGNSSSMGEVNVGNRTITGVAAGIAGTDAVNVNQLDAGVDYAINQANQYTDSRIDGLANDVWTMDRGYRGATASAMAMAGLPQAYLPGKSMLAVGFGGYQSEYGMAIGLSGITDNGRFVYKAQASGNTTREWGFSVGAGIQW